MQRWAIGGPTAVGKTAVAIELAKRLDSGCISVDAVAVYKGFDIGSAKPTEQERAQVSWHGIDIAEPDDNFTLKDYTDHAEATLHAYSEQGKTPILVGGTGLYLRPILATLSIPPVPPQPTLRARWMEQVDEIGSAFLFEKLSIVDPDSASRIMPADVNRILRALEVYEVTGKPMSSWRTPEGVHGVPKPGARLIVLDRETDDLDARIHQRVSNMMTNGFLAEVEGLLQRGISKNTKPMLSLGYRHLVQYIQGSRSLQETVDLIAQDTRRYSRRQRTWFRSDPLTQWIHVAPGTSVSDTADEVWTQLKVNSVKTEVKD